MAAGPPTPKPPPRGEGVRVMIVAAAYYEAIEQIVAATIAGAERVLRDAGAACEVLHVPGALEIPGAIVAAHRAAAQGHIAPVDGYVALGCVIRGDTTHYEIVSEQSARALMDLTLDPGLAIGNGILTVENEDQAWARARPSEPNKGAEAARAALHMIALKRQFAGAPR